MTLETSESLGVGAELPGMLRSESGNPGDRITERGNERFAGSSSAGEEGGTRIHATAVVGGDKRPPTAGYQLASIGSISRFNIILPFVGTCRAWGFSAEEGSDPQGYVLPHHFAVCMEPACGACQPLMQVMVFVTSLL